VRRGPSRAYWICQAAGWSLYLVVTTLQLAGSEGVKVAFFLTLFAAVTGVLLTHGARYIIRRRRWIALGATALAPRIVAGSFALAIVYVAILSVVETLVEGANQNFLLVALYAVLRWSMAFFIWLAIYCGYGLIQQRQEEQVRRLEAEKEQKEAELRALRSQLNPHFLFNALNSVRALIAEDPELAQDAVTRVARILRYSLAEGRAQTTTLGSEIDVVDDYLALEGLRLAERLVVERTISEEARRVEIPVLLLQLLVENSLKHGIAELPRGGVLRIVAAVNDGVLELEVDNPRPEREVRSESTGLGLANASERLRLLFGPGATLSLDLSSPAIARVHVRLPVR
jgi:two-component system sensor histidine kinase AlgZ